MSGTMETNKAHSKAGTEHTQKTCNMCVVVKSSTIEGYVWNCPESVCGSLGPKTLQVVLITKQEQTINQNTIFLLYFLFK